MQVANIATIAALAKNSALQTKKSIAEALGAAGLRKNRADEVLAFRAHIYAQRKVARRPTPALATPWSTRSSAAPHWSATPPSSDPACASCCATCIAWQLTAPSLLE